MYTIKKAVTGYWIVRLNGNVIKSFSKKKSATDYVAQFEHEEKAPN